MKSHQKLVLNSMIALVVLFSSPFLWKNNLEFALFQLVVSSFLFFLNRSKASVVVYVCAFIFGTIAEYYAVHAGVWNYANSTINGLPLWIPFVWGSVSLVIINMSDFISDLN